MKYKASLHIMILAIVALAGWSATVGINSYEGSGPYVYTSIRGKNVTIYGKGLYQHMSVEVAPQGIAQDYVTLFIGIPFLLLSLWLVRKDSMKGRYLLAGTLGYFLVTYLFYTVMSMYNQMFLVYVALMGTSFFAFLVTLLSFGPFKKSTLFKVTTPVQWTGRFLLFSSLSIALLWLSIVVPPLLDGTIIPVQVEHYTTLIVQGLDLGLLLPTAFIVGVLWIKRTRLGYLLAPVYFIFLSLLMTALSAKVIAMSVLGYDVMPVIFIIPCFNVLSIICMVSVLRNVNEL